MGGQGVIVRTLADLGVMQEVIRSRSRGKPLLIDLKLDPATMPRTF